jgi:hypothetical protein
MDQAISGTQAQASGRASVAASAASCRSSVEH